MKDTADPPRQTPSNAGHDPGELGLHRKLGHDLIPLHRWDHRDEDGRERGKSPRDGGWRSAEYDGFDAATHMAGGGNVGARLRATDLVVDVDPRGFEQDEIGTPIDPTRRFCADLGVDLSSCPTVETGGGVKRRAILTPDRRPNLTPLDRELVSH